MFKFLIKLIFILLVLVLGAAFSLYTYLPSMVAKKIEKIAQVPTTIRSLGGSFDEIEVNKLSMKNLPNSILPEALSIEDIRIGVPITEFLKNEINIDEIICDKFTIALEFDSKSSNIGNWTRIIKNMNQNTSQENKASKVINIRKLLLNKVKVNLVYKDNPKEIKKIEIKKIELKNLSTAGDFPIDQLSKIIIQQALKEIFSLQNLGNMLKNLLIPKTTPPVIKPFAPFFSKLEDKQIKKECL